MTIEIRVTSSDELAGEVVSEGASVRFSGWLGLLRALSGALPGPSTPERTATSLAAEEAR